MNQRQLLLLLALTLLGSAQALAQARPQPKPATPSAAASQTPAPAAKQKPPAKDEVYFSIGRRINAVNNTAVSGVVAALDGVIEVKEIALGADGKATVTVQERAPSNASYTQKSTRLILAPAGGDKWNWEQFEDARRFYAVEKIFTYTQNDLGRKKQNIAAKWSNITAAVSKQTETAIKLLETAKALLKGDPPQMSTLIGIRSSLNEAVKNNDQDALINVQRDLVGQTEGIVSLGDGYELLKTNDAYLRLLDEFKGAVNFTKAARKDYVQAVELYNESLVRLPFALVAYGLEFQRIEPKIEAE
jgi:LemA protein